MPPEIAGYCTSNQVRAIADTDITDNELNELIQESSAWMDIELDTENLDTLMRQMICRTHVASRCMLKDPISQSLGQYQEDRAGTLDGLKDLLFNLMVAASKSPEVVFVGDDQQTSEEPENSGYTNAELLYRFCRICPHIRPKSNPAPNINKKRKFW